MSTVWYMVDDTDPRLEYSGSWSFVSNTQNSFDQSSRSGPAFNSTLHSTSGNVTASFRFNGTSYLGVYGTLDGRRSDGSLGIVTCLLDGAPIGRYIYDYPLDLTQNNIIVCHANSTFGGWSPGEHELLINVTNWPNSVWHLDYITYESLANPDVDGQILQVGNPDLVPSSNYSSLNFGPGWTVDAGDGSTVTATPGSTAVLKFNGTSVSLFGDLSNISNTAAYQIDNDTPVTIQLPGQIGASTSTVTNQLLFTASNLSVAEHTVSVAFNGSQQGMPLDISYFYVQSLTSDQQELLNSSSSTSTSISTATHTGSAVSTSPRHSNHGAIIGAILGSVIPALLIIFGILLYWRKLKQRKADLATAPTPFHPVNRERLSQNVTIALSKNREKTYSSRITFNEMASTLPSSSSISGDRSSTNILPMKLRRFLPGAQDQIQQGNQRLGEGIVQQHEMRAVHIDSGLRLTEDGVLRQGSILVEAPPDYTAE
ncbi:hypothetical protein GYMLUDRAFT_260063 [Collybiopsis luxurians FD-317 M1]|uniref:Uncharacterized protein n=1 Tax=Collybiopsis luxurians FD-317 M1 TaxID=944289 RepID=A0A0D0CJ97_9AGAR|nr:hypothetical protein GYMLUDRAFT_260063 [Collybiopsis luxurians FD-317 M1]